MIVLGIETSCDETAVAVVNNQKKILSHQLVSQIESHKKFGGVVPEIAAREHLSVLPKLLTQTMSEAKVTWNQLDAVAVTAGPGLIGGVMVGVMMAKSIAMSQQKPFIAVNHLAAHILTIRLTIDIAFPYMTLLVSGGHCQLVYVKSANDYLVLGSTIDDAVGECFDKTARLLGLPYPGGAEIEKLATLGDPLAFDLPVPFRGRITGQEAYQFSYSGLKSAVKRIIEVNQPLTDNLKQDIAASLQHAIAASLVDRSRNALQYCRDHQLKINGFVLCGGVAANQVLRSNLEHLTTQFNSKFHAPPLNLCTDNGVMVAWAGVELYAAGITHPLSFKPRPRWPLSELNDHA